jgi:hypothetical protein
MRSKSVLWAAVLAFAVAVPSSAQPELVGGELKVNTNNVARQIQPVVAFQPSGDALFLWTNDRYGLLARAWSRDGSPAGPEQKLVPNSIVPTIPFSGEILYRKDPAAVWLPSGELFVAWTEQRDHMILDHFFEDHKILDQDVYGQRFDASGQPIGAPVRLNTTTEGYQARPKIALRGGTILVVWESGSTFRSQDALYGQLLTRKGRAIGSELRIDAGAGDLWNSAVAGTPSGQFLTVWEGTDSDGPGVLARLYDASGEPAGAPFVVNKTTAGRQRRPSVVATRDGGFLVAWQGYQNDGTAHGIYGQYLNAAGVAVGSEFLVSKGVGQVQIAPALALLPSGNAILTWMEWQDNLPLGVYSAEVDRAGHVVGQEMKISTDRVYPQYRTTVATDLQGHVLTAWESRIGDSRSIAARRLTAD